MTGRGTANEDSLVSPDSLVIIHYGNSTIGMTDRRISIASVFVTGGNQAIKRGFQCFAQTFDDSHSPSEAYQGPAASDQ